MHPAVARTIPRRAPLYPIASLAILFALYHAIEQVAARNLTPQFRTWLGTLVELAFYYALLSTARLIWVSARRIVAGLRDRWPVMWRPIPFLSSLTAPVLFVSAVVSAAMELVLGGRSLDLLLHASIIALLFFIRRRDKPTSFLRACLLQ